MKNSNYKNFAQQPEGGGMITVLTGFDLTTDVVPSKVDKVFQKRSIFIDNCNTCNMKYFNAGTFKNTVGNYSDYYDAYGNSTNSTTTTTSNSGDGKSGGGFFSGLNLANLLQTGATIYTNTQQQQLAEQTAQITANQAQAAQANAAAAAAQAKAEAAKGSIIKAYGLPIAIGGGILIVGIATYFFFKKKKIN